MNRSQMDWGVPQSMSTSSRHTEGEGASSSLQAGNSSMDAVGSEGTEVHVSLRMAYPRSWKKAADNCDKGCNSIREHTDILQIAFRSYHQLEDTRARCWLRSGRGLLNCLGGTFPTIFHSPEPALQARALI